MVLKILKKKKISRSLFNIDKIFHSTSHFTLVDKYKNVLSATSSIESSFGSRIQVNGFILNNQLTDFRFKIKDSNNNKLKNIPKGNKRPLSSMTPLIIFDNKNDFFLTIGSPGGKAIISYIFRVLSDELYSNSNIEEIVEDPNFIRINGKTFFESSHLNKISTNKGKIRNLTSGIAIIKKKSGSLIGIADSRRDGTVRGR